MSTKLLTSMLLAAGLAVGKPVSNYRTLQDLTSRQGAPLRANVGAVPSSGMISALATLGTKGLGEVPQVRAENFVFIDVGDNNERENGRAAVRKLKGDRAAQELVLQQVNQALLADQRENAAEAELDNVLREAAFAQKEPEITVVVLIVREINIIVNDAGVKLFKQEALVANRGKRETKTVMVYDSRTLTATDAKSIPKATGAPLVTKTVDAVLFDAKPTHEAVVEDPAALLRRELEAALVERQKDANRENDERLNVNIAVGKANGRNEDDQVDEVKDDKNLKDDEVERLKELEREREEQRKEELKEQQKEEEAKKLAEQEKKDREQLRKDAEQREREQDKKEAEKLAEAEQDAEEKAKKDAEEKAKKDAEEKAKKDAEEKAKKDAVEKARKDAEEKAKKDAEEKAKLEAEKAKKDADAEAKKEAEEKVKEAEEKLKKEVENKAKKDAEEKARADAEAKKLAEEKAQAEAKAKAEQ